MHALRVCLASRLYSLWRGFKRLTLLFRTKMLSSRLCLSLSSWDRDVLNTTSQFALLQYVADASLAATNFTSNLPLCIKSEITSQSMRLDDKY